MTDWKEYKIGAICEVIGGGTPSTTIPEYWNGDIAWLTPKDLTGYTNVYIKHGERFITEEGLRNSSARILPAGSVLLTSRAPIGYVAIAENEICTNQGFKNLKVDSKIADNLFIYYWLKNNTDYLQSIGTGSTFAEISGSTVKGIDIALPPLPLQKQIGVLLHSLDNKIDLLKRQNSTLDKLANAIFRQKFVEEATDEWETEKLFMIAQVQNGYAFSSRDYVEFQAEHLEVLKMGHIEKGGGLRPNPKRDFVPRNEKLNRWILNKGDIIMAMTDMKDNVVILGVPAMIDKSDKYVLNQRVARVTLKGNDRLINNFLLYIQMKDPEFIATLQSKANSGVQVNLSTESIKECEILIPPLEIQKEFGTIISNLYLKKENNDFQIQSLSKLRDSILPKLMSGEITINTN